MNPRQSVPNHVKRLRASPLLRAISTNVVGVIHGQPQRLVQRWHLLADRRTPFFVFALFSLLFLTIGLGSLPVQLWDESRLAVNAMEMHLHGLSLVTTYEFMPDHWNTKPPLLIWLMALTMKAVGPAEFALRLPSAVAGAATVCVTVYFCWRVTRSVAWSLFAGAQLLGAPEFIGPHAAATGDYDALLTFFTTAYLSLLFFVLHREKPKFAKLLLAALCISAAVLTKDIAGVIPGVGVALYLLLVSRWRRVLAVQYLIAGLVALVPIAVYYFWREQIDPGYFSSVSRTELLRYARTLDNHEAPFYYYFAYLLSFFGSTLFPLLVPFGWWFARGRSRAALTYAMLVAAAVMVTYSMAASKLHWYIVPALPWLVVAVTLSARSVLQRLDSVAAQRVARLGLLLMAVMSVAYGIAYRHWRLPRHSFAPQDMYGHLLKVLYDQGERTVHILDGGVENNGGLVRYTPQLRYYALYWSQHGANVQLLSEAGAAQLGDLIGTCDPNKRAAIASIADATPILQDNNCLAVKVISEH